MKYMILGFAVIISISWHMLQSNRTSNSQDTKIQINGKVHNFKGKIVVNIQDNYLTLSAFDRFTLLIRGTEKLTMQVVDKPENQQCKIVQTKNNNNVIRLNIYCQIAPNLVLNASTLKL